MSATTLHEHRWPLQPLLDTSGLSVVELRRRLGVELKTITGAATAGLTDLQADRWAISLNWHPLLVWGWDWIDLVDQAAPTHIQLAAILRDQINRGDLSPGDQLPTGPALAQRYDVSRRTVTRAVAELRDEGLVTTGRGCHCTVIRHDNGEAVRAS